MTGKSASAAGAVTLDVALLGRSYKVACSEAERAELENAVAFLDGRMRDIRDGGKVTGADRIAVTAALNIAHELLRARAHPGALGVAAPEDATTIDDSAARRRIGAMESAIDEVLAGFE